MIQDEMDGNGLRTGGLRFRTETQRGPENTEELFLAAEGLIEFVSDCRLARLRTEQRARRGTASQFPAQREYHEEGRKTMEMKWQNAGLSQREEAAMQPGSNGSYVSNGGHRGTEESGEESV